MLTSGEVQQLLEARGQKLSELSAARLDAIVSGIPDSPHLYGIPGGSGLQPSSPAPCYWDAGAGLGREHFCPPQQLPCPKL